MSKIEVSSKKMFLFITAFFMFINKLCFPKKTELQLTIGVTVVSIYIYIYIYRMHHPQKFRFQIKKHPMSAASMSR